MKVLIVGGTSSVGLSLKPVLSGFCEVVTAGRTGCDFHFDLNDPVEKMSLPSDIDAVIHLAAHFGGKTDEEIEAAERLNVLGTLKLCQAAVRSNVRHFVFVSSIFSVLTEASKFYSSYSISKKHAEEILRFYLSDKPMKLTILRPSQIYGASEHFRLNQPFFYQIIDKAANGENIEFYGSNDALRNYLYIEDLTMIISKVVQKTITGDFDCINPVDTSYSQVAKAAIAAFGSKSAISFLSDKPDIPDNVFVKNDDLYREIDFLPRVSIEEGMRKIAVSRKELQ